MGEFFSCTYCRFYDFWVPMRYSRWHGLYRIGTPVKCVHAKISRETFARFVHAAGWRGTTVRKTYDEMVNSTILPLGFQNQWFNGTKYHLSYNFQVSHIISARRSGQKKASILKPRNFWDQFWNLQLKGYPGLYRVLWFKSTVTFRFPIIVHHPVPLGTLTILNLATIPVGRTSTTAVKRSTTGQNLPARQQNRY
eukprot:SAG11_NODE_1860_length_4155_cov_6.625092_2_plen_195_part_00